MHSMRCYGCGIYELLKEPDKRDLPSCRRLYHRFNEVFWWEAEGTTISARKDKRPMETVASNAGHCLSSGIVPPNAPSASSTD